MRIHNAFQLGLVGTLGVGVGLLILGSVVSLSTIIVYIGAAMFLALGLDPIVTWLESRSFPRWAALLAVILGVLSVFAGIVWMVVPIIAAQISKLVALIPQIQEQIGDLTLLQYLEQQFPFVPFDEIIDSAADWLADAGNVTDLSSGILNVAFTIGSFFFGALIILILTLYFTASMPSMRRGMYALVPASKRDRFQDLTEQITDSIGYYVIGQTCIATCNGILTFIFLSIIQAPFPPVLAVIAFIGSMIPLVGTLSASVIITLTCLIPGLGSPLTALVAGAYYLVYMQVEAYVISPNVMHRAVSIPGSLVVIAALAGGALLGLLGALIAIPTAASILLVLKQVVVPMQDSR